MKRSEMHLEILMCGQSAPTNHEVVRSSRTGQANQNQVTIGVFADGF